MSIYSTYYHRAVNFFRERRREVLVFIVVFLLILLSFGAGFLAARRFQKTPIIIEKCSA